MLSRRIEIGIGIATVALALFLLFVAIPVGVATPRSVRSIFLSPIFWPTILSIALLLIGLGLAFRAIFRFDTTMAPEAFETFDRPALARLAAFFVLIIVYYKLIDPLGMVWSSIAAFLAVLIITRSKTPVIGAISGIALPLLLYVFFYHVASVPVPQGDFVRLP